MKKGENGVTLVALIVTVIVLIILAGVTIQAIVGDNGIINKTRKAAEDTERAKVQEELEMIITELEMGALMEKRNLTSSDIKNALDRLGGISVQEVYQDYLYGEYKNFAFIINDKIVTVNESKISGDTPILNFVNLNDYGDSSEKDDVELKVVGRTKDGGTIEKIEVVETNNVRFMEGDERNSDYGVDSVTRMYKITDNGTYHFTVTSSNGRMYAESVVIGNATPRKKDLLTGIADLTTGGYKRIKVDGKTTEVKEKDEVKETEVYTLSVAYCDSDLILKNGSFTKERKADGSVEEVAKIVDGLSYNADTQTWSVGEAKDVNSNSVVLKVDGDLTLDKDYILTSVKNGTDCRKRVIYILYRNFNNKWNSKYE